MKIALDLRHLAPAAPPAWTPFVQALEELLRDDRDHHYLLFCTLANYRLLAASAPNLRRITLPDTQYDQELDNHLAVEGDVDVLVRTGPASESRFPLSRQVICLTDPHTQTGPDQLRVLRAVRSEAAVLLALTAKNMTALRADPWTRCQHVLLAENADTLREAIRHVAAPVREIESLPVVSIVTPSFNQGPYLRRTIESVLSQDYPHIDYRVVDGGSTDDTLAILRSYGDRFPWISEPDRGQAHAINKGLAKARGEIFAYLNSDDLLRPGAVRRVVEHFRRRPACDLVYGRAMFIDPDDRYLAMYPTRPYSFDGLMDDCIISQPAAFWTRRIADAVGPFDEHLRLTMDYDYWLRIDRAGGRIEHSDELLACTRMHPSTKTAAMPRERFFDEIWRTCLRHGGYVSANYVSGWVTLCLERKLPLLRHLHKLTVGTTYYWHNVRRRRKGPSFMTRAASALVRKMSRLVHRPPPGARPDNWLPPECELDAVNGLSLLGEAPVAMKLAVWQGKRHLTTIELPAQTPVAVDVPEAAGPVTLRFSDHVPSLLDGQPVAFRLYGANLERDAA